MEDTQQNPIAPTPTPTPEEPATIESAKEEKRPRLKDSGKKTPDNLAELVKAEREARLRRGHARLKALLAEEHLRLIAMQEWVDGKPGPLRILLADNVTTEV